VVFVKLEWWTGSERIPGLDQSVRLERSTYAAGHLADGLPQVSGMGALSVMSFGIALRGKK
jgi:hypothetical protein